MVSATPAAAVAAAPSLEVFFVSWSFRIFLAGAAVGAVGGGWTGFWYASS